jgi:hypothetical protein
MLLGCCRTTVEQGTMQFTMLRWSTKACDDAVPSAMIATTRETSKCYKKRANKKEGTMRYSRQQHRPCLCALLPQAAAASPPQERDHTDTPMTVIKSFLNLPYFIAEGEHRVCPRRKALACICHVMCRHQHFPVGAGAA